VDLLPRAPLHSAADGASSLEQAAWILILAGLGVRLPAAPFHVGCAETSDAVPWGIAAALATLPKAAVAVALVRLVAGIPAGHRGTVQLLVLLLGGLTMFAGGIVAATQTRLRGILRGIGMAYGGLVLGGIAVALWEAAHPGQRLTGSDGLPGGAAAALFSLSSDALLSCGVFAVLAYLASEERPIEELDDLAGLLRTEPAAAVCLTVLLIGLAGLPLLPGFWGRLWVVAAALGTLGETSAGNLQPVPHGGFLALAIVIALSSLLVAAACLRVLGAILFEGSRARPRPSGGQSALVAGVLATLIAIVIGLLPGPLLHALRAVEPGGSAVESP
jgi:NADH-quinone oxidoreductase subunit N